LGELVKTSLVIISPILMTLISYNEMIR